ncbi:MAG: hypothetical protein C4323_01720 [Mastigocladus sp. ERB_26_2]
MLHIKSQRKLLHTLEIAKYQAKIYEQENRLGFDTYFYEEGKIFLNLWLPTEEQALDDARNELEFWAGEEKPQFSVAQLRLLYQEFASDRSSFGEVSEFLNWLEEGRTSRDLSFTEADGRRLFSDGDANPTLP